MAGLQSGEVHMMINSVVWVQYINVTDTQQTDSHFAIANASGDKNTAPISAKMSQLQHSRPQLHS